MRIAKNPTKILADLLLFDSFPERAHLIGMENDKGATRLYVASETSIDAGVVTRHYIKTEEIPLSTPGLRELLGINPPTPPANRSNS